MTLCFVCSYAIAQEPVAAGSDVDSTGTGISAEDYQQSLDSLQRETELMSFQLSYSDSSAEPELRSNRLLAFSLEMVVQLIEIGNDLIKMADSSDIEKRLLDAQKDFLTLTENAIRPESRDDNLIFYISRQIIILQDILQNGFSAHLHERSEPILLAPEQRREETFFTVSYEGPVRGSDYQIEVNDLQQVNKVSLRGKIPGNALSIEPTNNTQKDIDSNRKKLTFTLWPTINYNYIDSNNDSDVSIQESKAALSELADSVNQLKKNFLTSTTTLSKDEASSLDMSLINNFAGTLSPQLDYANLLSYISEGEPLAVSLENYLLSSLRPLTSTPSRGIDQKDIKGQMEITASKSQALSDAKIYKMARQVYENNLSDINNSFKQDLSSIKNNVDGPVLIKNNGAMAALIRINKKSSK